MPTFIANTKIYDKYKNSTEAMAVYNFLKLQENVDKMILATGKVRPALDGVVDELEEVFENNQIFSFNDHNVRQCVGRMAEFILESYKYGYTTVEDMSLKDKKFFKNAMRYRI